MPGLRLRRAGRACLRREGAGSDDICPCCGFQFGLDDFPYEDREGPMAEWRGRRDDGGQWRQDGGTR